MAILRLLFLTLLALATVQLVVGYLPAIFRQDLGGHFIGIFDHKSNVTYVNAITASLLLADIISANQARRLLGLSRTIWVIAFTILLLTTYLSGARNGVVVLLSVLLIAFGFYVLGLRESTRRKIWGVIAVLAIFLSVALWAMLKSDTRWERFLATAAGAWNIDVDTAWVSAQEILSYAVCSTGKPSDASGNGLRSALTHAVSASIFQATAADARNRAHLGSDFSIAHTATDKKIANTAMTPHIFRLVDPRSPRPENPNAISRIDKRTTTPFLAPDK